MKLRVSLFISLFSIITLLTDCKKEYGYIRNPEKEAFDFIVTESQRNYINASRGEKYVITDPVPELHLAGKTYTIDRFGIRGANTLNFTRKGFAVNMGRKIPLYDSFEQRERNFEKFKLLAMVYDYTYIENSTAVGLFREVGLWPLFDFFTEVRLSGHTQGLYHFIEDPVGYFIEREGSPAIIRRGYDHVVKSSDVGPSNLKGEDYYIGRFRRIYSLLPEYSGKQIYDSLSSYMDLEQYFTKLSIDLLIKNGDYTDEIFFYSKIRDNKELFGVFPWDYDDIFANQPHEIGNSWAPGTVFGSRHYNSIDDVTADVGFKLLYSIEDDLDYKVAKDSVLYQEYLKVLRGTIEKIGPATIDKVFDYTFERIGPFYSNDTIIAQSRYDVDPTNYDLFLNNLAEKRQMLKDRRSWILEQLDIQENKLLRK